MTYSNITVKTSYDAADAAPASLGFGELAINVATGKLFTKVNATDGVVDFSPTYDKAGIATITAPPKINNRDHRWSVLNFANGGSTPAPTDHRNIFEAALSSGEKIWVPPQDYPINSHVNRYGIKIEQAGLHIDVECHNEARILVGSAFDTFDPAPASNSCYVFAFKSFNNGEAAASRVPTERFRWSGGTIDFSANNTSSAVPTTHHGCTLMTVEGYLKPEISGVYFNGGRRNFGTSGFGGDVGAGHLDTCLGISYAVDAVVTHCVFQGAFDLAVYENGIGHQTNTSQIITETGSNVVTMTFVNPPAVTIGDRIFPIGGTIGGINFNQEMTISSYEGGNTYKVTARSAANANVTHTSAVLTTFMSTARLGWEMPQTSPLPPLSIKQGEGSLYAFNHFSNCNGALSMKRFKKGTRIIGNHFRDCGAGIKMSDTDGDHNFGAHLLVMGNTFNRISGRPIASYGSPGVRIIGNEILDFAKNLGNGNFSDTTTGTAAIDLISSPGAIVQGNSVRQSPKFAQGTPAAGKEPVAFRLMSGEGFLDASNNCDITGNVVIDVNRYLHEYTVCSNNTFDNTVSGTKTASAVGGGNPTLTVRGSRSFEPEIAFSLSGSATYNQQSGSFRIVNSVSEVEVYIDLQPLPPSGPSGNAKIVLPVTNKTGYALHTSACVGQNMAIGSGWQLVGRLNNNSNELVLYKISNGVLQAITPTELSPGAKIQLDIRVPMPAPGTIVI